MSKHLFPGFVVLPLLTPSLAQAQALSIEHQAVACAAAEKFPRLEARFAPVDTVAVARVVFQGQTADWYSVAMKQEGAVFAGVLPKPKKSLKSFRYYIEVTDKTLGTNRTAEFTATVADSSSACQGRIMAGALGSASVILQGPAGVAALPAGFASSGVVAGSAAGSSAGAAGADPCHPDHGSRFRGSDGPDRRTPPGPAGGPDADHPGAEGRLAARESGRGRGPSPAPRG